MSKKRSCKGTFPSYDQKFAWPDWLKNIFFLSILLMIIQFFLKSAHLAKKGLLLSINYH